MSAASIARERDVLRGLLHVLDLQPHRGRGHARQSPIGRWAEAADPHAVGGSDRHGLHVHPLSVRRHERQPGHGTGGLPFTRHLRAREQAQPVGGPLRALRAGAAAVGHLVIGAVGDDRLRQHLLLADQRAQLRAARGRRHADARVAAAPGRIGPVTPSAAVSAGGSRATLPSATRFQHPSQSFQRRSAACAPAVVAAASTSASPRPAESSREAEATNACERRACHRALARTADWRPPPA